MDISSLHTNKSLAEDYWKSGKEQLTWVLRWKSVHETRTNFSGCLSKIQRESLARGKDILLLNIIKTLSYYPDDNKNEIWAVYGVSRTCCMCCMCSASHNASHLPIWASWVFEVEMATTMREKRKIKIKLEKDYGMYYLSC